VTPGISALRPLLAVPGGRVTIEGGPFAVDGVHLPVVRVGPRQARVAFATAREIVVQVPPDLEGTVAVRIDDAPGASVMLELGVVVATGVHQVDSPVVDHEGNVYLTCSGSRGQRTPVSVYRVRPDGTREIHVTGLTNPTSMAFGPDGRLYVSSRFDGTVSRIDEEGRAEVFATDLGIACGIAFGLDGTLFVGDRSGTIFRIDATGEVRTFATLPSSTAAFHLAMGADAALYVSVPTLASSDRVYRIEPDGQVKTFAEGFGRPQGLAIDASGRLHVVEALAGDAGLFSVDPDGTRTRVLSAPRLVGATFGPSGGLVVTSNETAWRFPSPAPA
jgi:sugar lactone lactonase YvrE